MKKLLFVILLNLLFISNTFAVIRDSFYLGEKVLNMYIEEYDDNNFHNGAPFLLHRSDNEIVYCINPFKYINETNYYNGYNTNNKIFNLTDKQIDKINLIAYYGYGYGNHNENKWYGITQFLIWKQLNFTDIYFTDKYHGTRVTAYVNEIDELEEMVNSYYKLPSFAYSNYEYNPNTEYKITDLNNVLSNYDVLESNIDVKKINNDLIIDTATIGTYEIKFIKRGLVKKDYILYDLEGAQSLIYPGRINDIIFNLTIKVNGGSITIKKFDSDTSNPILGSKQGLYNNKELITTIETNQFGVGYIDNLPLGQYYVKEVLPSKGYLLSEEEYLVNLTKENSNIIINSYSKKIDSIIKFNINNISNTEKTLYDKDVLEVEVEDTYVKKNNAYIILILIGCALIIIGKIKTTKI